MFLRRSEGAVVQNFQDRWVKQVTSSLIPHPHVGHEKLVADYQECAFGTYASPHPSPEKDPLHPKSGESGFDDGAGSNREPPPQSGEHSTLASASCLDKPKCERGAG